MLPSLRPAEDDPDVGDELARPPGLKMPASGRAPNDGTGPVGSERFDGSLKPNGEAGGTGDDDEDIAGIVDVCS